MSYVAAGVCLFTLAVHTFGGQRRVVVPMNLGLHDAFARGTLTVVWHMVTFTLATLVPMLLLGEVRLAALLCAGYAGIFIAVAQVQLGSALRLPQWLLLGPVSIFAVIPHPAALLLGLIALAHAAWGLGISWPEKTPRSLALAVIGRTVLPSKMACWTVCVGLAAMVAALLRPSLPPWVRIAIASVFLVRGVYGFVEVKLRPRIAGTPYESLSRYMYSPLSFSIGAAAWAGG
jgi:hypothetical protein